MKNLFKDISEQDYKYDIYGTKFAKFDYEYIKQVKNYVKGDLKVFFDTMLDGYGHTFNKNGSVFLNEFQMQYILNEIKDFKRNNCWNDCSKEGGKL